MSDGKDITRETGELQDARAVLAVLRAPDVSTEMLRQLGRDARWLQHYEVKKALVSHPKTPLVISRGLVGHLRWCDLADTARDPRPHPIVRRDAERYLRTRARKLSTGERVALARRATRGLIPTLLESDDSRVLRSLLGNGQLLEAEVAGLASSLRSPPDVLISIATHHNWSRRRPVRFAVLANSRTPVSVALRVIESLPHADLRHLAGSATVPRIVRVGAERRLQRGAKPPGMVPGLGY